VVITKNVEKHQILKLGATKHQYILCCTVGNHPPLRQQGLVKGSIKPAQSRVFLGLISWGKRGIGATFARAGEGYAPQQEFRYMTDGAFRIPNNGVRQWSTGAFAAGCYIF